MASGEPTDVGKVVASTTGVVQAMKMAMAVTIPEAPQRVPAEAKIRSYAQGWADCRKACLELLEEIATVGERYEAALAFVERMP